MRGCGERAYRKVEALNPVADDLQTDAVYGMPAMLSLEANRNFENDLTKLHVQSAKETLQISLTALGPRASLETAPDEFFGGGMVEEAPASCSRRNPSRKSVAGTAFFAAAITPSGKAAMLCADRLTNPRVRPREAPG